MLFSICLALSTLLLGVFSDIMKGSDNTIKKVGDNVEFPCVTERRNCSDVDWAKQEGSQSSVAIYKSASGMLNSWKYPFERYNVSLVDGCNLTIRNLKLSDSGLFSCVETKGTSDAARKFFLAVIESATECETNATKDIAEDSAYIDKCSVKFQPELIKPSKLELRWSNGRGASPVNSTEADTIELAHNGVAKPKFVEGFNCTVTLHVDQASPPTHDKMSTSSSACTLPIRYVLHPVTKISCYSGTKEVIKEVHKSQILECTADGYPLPSCQCKSSKTEETTWSCSSFTIPETSLPGDIITCTATNTVSGKTSTVTVTFTVTKEGSNEVTKGSSIGLIVGIVVAVVVLVLIAVGIPVFLFKTGRIGGGRERRGESTLPLKEPAPPKPPRANSTQIYRPQSPDVQYAQLAREENPRIMPTNRTTNPPPSTIYAQVNNA